MGHMTLAVIVTQNVILFVELSYQMKGCRGFCTDCYIIKLLNSCQNEAGDIVNGMDNVHRGMLLGAPIRTLIDVDMCICTGFSSMVS